MNNANVGPNNAEIARGIRSDMAWGATFGAVTGGPAAVPMPTVPMGPTPFKPSVPPIIKGMSINDFLKKHKALN